MVMNKEKEQLGKILHFPYSNSRFLRLYMRQIKLRRKVLFISSFAILIVNFLLLSGMIFVIFYVVK